MLAALGVDALRVLFLDDEEANISAAAQPGMRTVHVDGSGEELAALDGSLAAV